MTTKLSQTVAMSMVAVLALSALVAGIATDTVSAASQGQFLITLQSTRDDALPGDTIGWILNLTNDSDVDITGVRVQKAITKNHEGVEYLTDSGVMKLSTKQNSQGLSDEWGWKEAVLTNKPFTLTANTSLRVEWKETATGKVLNDFVQTSVAVFTDETQDPRPVFKNIYMVDPSKETKKTFTAAMSASSPTITPGAQLDYQVIVENTGNVALKNIVINADLPNGRDAQWVNYIPGSASFTVDNEQGEAVRDTWVGRDTGFNLEFLNPGQEFVLRYSVIVSHDAPHGLTLNSIANIRPDSADKWTQVAANTTVAVAGVDTPVAQLPGNRLPETGGVSAAAMALWLTAATGLTGGAFQAGRKMILG